MSQDTTTAEVRERAAQIIEARGWTQTPTIPPAPYAPTCLLLALQDAGPHALFVEARKEIQAELGLSEMGISRWNDAPGRTQADVLAALRGGHAR